MLEEYYLIIKHINAKYNDIAYAMNLHRDLL